MSNECQVIAQKRRVGSATKKAVLMYLADRASDDGSGIWTSKAHIAADTELSKRSVQNVMSEMLNDGLIYEVGKRSCRNGYTFEYNLNLEAIRALPSTRGTPANPRRKMIFERDDHTCQYCGDKPENLTIDHVVSRSSGGSDDPTNLVACCGPCNVEKGSMDVADFIKIKGVNVVHPCILFALKSASGSPLRVNPVHPNHPLTTHEPSNARERASDLFSAESEPQKQDQESEVIGKGFEEFWKDIWPSHQRKAGKVDCLKVYKAACIGTHPKAAKISPAELNAATRRYIASVSDKQFLKAPLAWLRQPGWEPFVGSAAPAARKPETYAQRFMREERERAMRAAR